MTNQWHLEDCPTCRSKVLEKVDEAGTPTYVPLINDLEADVILRDRILDAMSGIGVTMAYEHNIKVEAVPSQCGTPGHQDRLVSCTCNKLKQRLMHGSREDAQQAIFAHRITALEEAVGIKLNIEWAPGS